MIVRVHDDTTVVRALAEPAATACLSVGFEVVVGVGHDTDNCAAADEDHAGFARREAENCVVALACCELCAGTGAACHCGTLAGTELDIVYKGTDGNFTQREAVADLGSDTAAGGDNLTYLDTVGSDDITLLAILILYEGDAGAAVGVVLDGENGCSAFVLVAEEVDDTVHLLVAAAKVADGHLAGVVAATRALEGLKQ